MPIRPSPTRLMAGPLGRTAQRAIVGRVRALFNDTARGQTPVVRSDAALYPPDSIAWRVHGDVTTMMVGGVAALLLQMLHPAVLGGVWDHSEFREDMLGRLRRTARFMAVTTFAARDEAEAAIARVRTIHDGIRGTLPDGTIYGAGDPRLLAWVHVAGATSFLDGWIRYGEPRMSIADQDRYFAEAALVAAALGADPIPTTRREAMLLIEAMRPGLVSNARSREVARLVLAPRTGNPGAAAIQAAVFQSAVDLLPDWARRMHGLKASGFSRPLIHAGTFGLAETLRWAFRAPD
ncbi:MAG: oxygenase MpaB family protein [Pseudomonadota bacterium]